MVMQTCRGVVAGAPFAAEAFDQGLAKVNEHFDAEPLASLRLLATIYPMNRTKADPELLALLGKKLPSASVAETQQMLEIAVPVAEAPETREKLFDGVMEVVRRHAAEDPDAAFDLIAQAKALVDQKAFVARVDGTAGGAAGQCAAGLKSAGINRRVLELEPDESVIRRVSRNALSLAKSHADSNPKVALAILDSLGAVAASDKADAIRVEILESAVEKEPDAVEPAVELALVRERQREDRRHPRAAGSTSSPRWRFRRGSAARPGLRPRGEVRGSPAATRRLSRPPSEKPARGRIEIQRA